MQQPSPHRSLTSGRFIPKRLSHELQLPKANDSTRAAAARRADRIAYRLPLSLLHLGSFVSGKKGAPRSHFTLSSLAGPGTALKAKSSDRHRHGFLWVRWLLYLPERSVQAAAVQELRTHLASAVTSPFSSAFHRENVVPLKDFRLPAKRSGSPSIP